jgi:hypothetical protein
VSKHIENQSGIDSVATQLAAMFASTAAIASLFYAGGLANRMGYLGVFGAPWLSRDVSSADVFRGAFEILPSVAVVLIGVALLFRLSPSVAKARVMWWSATVLFACTVAVVALERIAGHRFTLEGRSAYHVAAIVAASIAAGLIAMFAVLSAVDTFHARFRTSALGVVVLSLLFVVVPLLTGRAQALGDLASPVRLPKAATLTSGELPVVAVTEDRVYCLVRRDADVPPKLIVLRWDDIKSIEAPANP